MATLFFTTQFKKDYKKCLKRNYDMNKIHNIFNLLEKNEKIPAKNKPHFLTGNYKDNMECHIENDWLLVWLPEDKNNVIKLVRTGTHSDIFG